LRRNSCTISARSNVRATLPAAPPDRRKGA
jgi:hypothetical protein